MNDQQAVKHRREAEDRWLLGLDEDPAPTGTLNVRLVGFTDIEIRQGGRLVWRSASTPATTRPPLRALPAGEPAGNGHV